MCLRELCSGSAVEKRRKRSKRVGFSAQRAKNCEPTWVDLSRLDSFLDGAARFAIVAAVAKAALAQERAYFWEAMFEFMH